MTVSRVLNNQSERFSEETRQRVLQAVRELEYAPVAQPMMQSRHVETRTLGLVFDGDPVEGFWGLPTFLGLKEAALRLDYDLLTLLRVPRDWMLGQEELQFLDRRNDGFIFVAPINRREIMQTLVRHQLPVVACYTADVPPEVSAIELDNAGALHLAVQHLVAQGHRHILHLTTMPTRTDFRERRRGYEQEMRICGLEPVVLSIDGLSGSDAAESLMAIVREHGITAIACVSDNLAAFAWDIAEAHGLDIPRDLSLVGMDDLVEMAKRGLTSVHFSCEEVGRRAIETVVNLISGGENSTREATVPVHLIHRFSVGPPA